MFAIPGILMLVFLIYVRPQEFWPPLAGIPFLYAFLFLAIYGQILDLKLRISKPMATPQLVPAILFFIWCLITMALWEVKNFVPEAILLTIALVLYFTPAHAVQSFRTFQLLAGTLIVIGIFLSIVGIHQAHSDWGCVFLDPTQPQNNAVGTPDGRPCEAAWPRPLPWRPPGSERSGAHAGDHRALRLRLLRVQEVAQAAALAHRHARHRRRGRLLLAVARRSARARRHARRVLRQALQDPRGDP